MNARSHGGAGTKAESAYSSPVRLILLVLSFSFVALGVTHSARRYTTVDGLPSDMVTCNKRDSHGFLWFCTPEGLSRFDGYTFVNYGVEQGLPDRYVNDFLETRTGEYLVATSRGLVLFNPKPGLNSSMFMVLGEGGDKTEQVSDLLEDRHGIVWVITAGGIRHLAYGNGQWVMSRPDFDLPPCGIDGVLEDDESNLWFVMYCGGHDARLARRHPGGKIDIFDDVFFRENRITSISEDRENNIWVGTYHGLGLLATHPRSGRRLIAGVYSRSDRSARPEISAVFQSSDGRRWVTTYDGTFELLGNPGSGKLRFQFFDREAQISGVEDIEGNFWSARSRTPRNGFISYGTEDGLATTDVRSIFEGNDGTLYAVTGLHNRYIHRFDGRRFVSVAPEVPGHPASWDWKGWGWGQTHLQDHLGEWWMATGFGLLRYPEVKRLEDLAHTPPKVSYPQFMDVFRLHETSNGDLWIAWWGSRDTNLTRWQRSTGQFHDFSMTLADSQFTIATALREDSAGNLWVGHWAGGVSRYRQGVFSWLIKRETLRSGTVSSLFLDHLGRMWAGTSRSGLLRFDDPAADHPAFRVYSTKEGLSSNDVRSIAEDRYGSIYFWTGRGVDRLNPETGHIRHYTAADGLVSPTGDHNVAFGDRNGTLWFGLDGLCRLDPQPDPPATAPPIRITKLLIRGAVYPVSELGEVSLSQLVLQPNQDQLQIEFASLNFASGGVIKYQYKLDGADRDWSSASDVRVVNYPRLSSGRYRFLVRAVNSEGLTSTAPAVIDFRLLPPLWKRWWFLTAVGILLVCFGYWAYQFRVQQLLELERVRTRIASDLHDDIGSSLTQIAIMSEVARRQDGHSAEPLERIADLSRELVDSMSDIVWAINPKRDRVTDLIQRMRRFANDLLEPAEIEVTFCTTPEHPSTPLQADIRRELFLIYKESLNNIARHAKCRKVDISVEIEGSQLSMKIRDDGRGFQAQHGNGRGHGLGSMRERARRLGGGVTIVSQPQGGTTLALTVPLNHPALLSHNT